MPTKTGKFEQIPLTLPVEPSIEREDLIISPSNSSAVALIDAWPDWPANVAVLAGPTGSGKSHMAEIWAEKANAGVCRMSDLQIVSSTISGHECLVLENAYAGDIDEEALFHVFNRLKSGGASLLITSREFPVGWQLKLPDLISRIRTAHVVELAEPDDMLLSGILVKLFADRQLQIEHSLIDYLVTRMERSTEAAGEIVSWLDHQALARQRKITRSLAIEALEHFEQMTR